MAYTTAPYGLVSGTTVVRDSALAATVQVVSASAQTLYEVQIDNSANAAQINYFKAWNDATVTIGTDDPDMIVRVPAGATLKMAITGGDADGVAFGTAFTIACVQEAGTAGTSAPTSSVAATLVIA